MVLEVAQVVVTPGSKEAFADAYRRGRPLLAEVEGCRSVRMTRGVKTPTTFTLLVEWDSVAAHEGDFRGTDRFTRWREFIGPHLARPPFVEHFTDVQA